MVSTSAINKPTGQTVSTAPTSQQNAAPTAEGSPTAFATAAASLADKAHGCLDKAAARREANDLTQTQTSTEEAENSENPKETEDASSKNHDDYMKRLKDPDKAYEIGDDD